MPYIKKARKYVRKARKAIKKRYNPRTVRGITNIVSDVAMLKRAMNSEKKVRTVSTDQVYNVGQYNGTGVDGAYFVDITVKPPQGVGGSSRIGNSIKFVSSMFQMQLKQQSQTKSPVRYRWTIICRPDNTVDMSASDMFNNFYDVNPFSDVRDYFANRDPEFFTAFKVIARGTGKMHGDETSSQQQLNFVKQPLKLNLHQKYDTASSVTTTKNKLYLVVQCDNGDIINPTYSGLQIEWTHKMWYVDN